MRLVTAKPDFVILSNYVSYERAAPELAKQGYRGPTLSALMTEEKVSLAKGALNGNISYGYQPASPQFVALFLKQRAGKNRGGLEQIRLTTPCTCTRKQLTK
jgi:hypothetical protein